MKARRKPATERGRISPVTVIIILAVPEVIAAGQALHPELKISIRHVAEHSSADDESDEAAESADRF